MQRRLYSSRSRGETKQCNINTAILGEDTGMDKDVTGVEEGTGMAEVGREVDVA